jgi:hypothetical protein
VYGIRLGGSLACEKCSLTITVGNEQLVSYRLYSSATAPIAIPNALKIKYIFLYALPTKIGAIDIIVVNQVKSTFTTFQKGINTFGRINQVI